MQIEINLTPISVIVDHAFSRVCLSFQEGHHVAITHDTISE